jgi:hypothetical protein
MAANNKPTGGVYQQPALSPPAYTFGRADFVAAGL